MLIYRDIYNICMKKTTSLTIEAEILEKAKEKGYNLSEIAERALRDKLCRFEVEIDKTITECGLCGREEEKATKENPIGLTWLWPDERWICSTCLKGKEIKLRAIK